MNYLLIKSPLLIKYYLHYLNYSIYNINPNYNNYNYLLITLIKIYYYLITL